MMCTKKSLIHYCEKSCHHDAAGSLDLYESGLQVRVPVSSPAVPECWAFALVSWRLMMHLDPGVSLPCLPFLYTSLLAASNCYRQFSLRMCSTGSMFSFLMFWFWTEWLKKRTTQCQNEKFIHQDTVLPIFVLYKTTCFQFFWFFFSFSLLFRVSKENKTNV